MYDLNKKVILQDVKEASGNGRTIALKNDGFVWYWRIPTSPQWADKNWSDSFDISKPISIMENCISVEGCDDNSDRDTLYMIKNDHTL